MRGPVSRNNEALVRPVFIIINFRYKLNRQQFLYGIISLFGVKKDTKIIIIISGSQFRLKIQYEAKLSVKT